MSGRVACVGRGTHRGWLRNSRRSGACGEGSSEGFCCEGFCGCRAGSGQAAGSGKRAGAKAVGAAAAFRYRRLCRTGRREAAAGRDRGGDLPVPRSGQDFGRRREGAGRAGEGVSRQGFPDRQRRGPAAERHRRRGHPQGDRTDGRAAAGEELALFRSRPDQGRRAFAEGGQRSEFHRCHQGHRVAQPVAGSPRDSGAACRRGAGHRRRRPQCRGQGAVPRQPRSQQPAIAVHHGEPRVRHRALRQSVAARSFPELHLSGRA